MASKSSGKAAGKKGLKTGDVQSEADTKVGEPVTSPSNEIRDDNQPVVSNLRPGVDVPDIDLADALRATVVVPDVGLSSPNADPLDATLGKHHDTDKLTDVWFGGSVSRSPLGFDPIADAESDANAQALQGGGPGQVSSGGGDSTSPIKEKSWWETAVDIAVDIVEEVFDKTPPFVPKDLASEEGAAAEQGGFNTFQATDAINSSEIGTEEGNEEFLKLRAESTADFYKRKTGSDDEPEDEAAEQDAEAEDADEEEEDADETSDGPDSDSDAGLTAADDVGMGPVDMSPPLLTRHYPTRDPIEPLELGELVVGDGGVVDPPPDGEEATVAVVETPKSPPIDSGNPDILGYPEELGPLDPKFGTGPVSSEKGTVADLNEMALGPDVPSPGTVGHDGIPGISPGVDDREDIAGPTG